MDIEYNYLLVSLSYIISVLGSFTALRLAMRIPTATSKALWGWVFSGAIALGGGAIWSMHFIAMLAYNAPMTITYDPAMTIFSLLLAITVVAVGLFIVGRGETSLGKLLAAGSIAGLGVCGMHYAGMAAMIMPADISYDVTIVILSIIIAVVAAVAAFWLAFNLRGNIQRFGSAFVMGGAVSGMHYTGMKAVTLIPHSVSEVIASDGSISPETLGLYIFGSVSIVLVGFLLITLFQAEQSENNEDDFLFE